MNLSICTTNFTILFSLVLLHSATNKNNLIFPNLFCCYSNTPCCSHKCAPFSRQWIWPHLKMLAGPSDWRWCSLLL